MSKKRVLVAMSGGVDSSAVAAILIEQGYYVEGATMWLMPDSENARKADRDAKSVARTLGIEHHSFHLEELFKRTVVDPFIGDYMCARTPNPCINCNKQLKFGAFLDKALEMGFDYIATGHYAAIEKRDGLYRLIRDTANRKDQTYVLYNMTQHTLAHTLFPIGGMPKDTVRRYAAHAGLKVADKPDSQEICFIPDNDYAGFITANTDCLPQEGDFTDISGKVIGRHRGIIHYTVGQRKGLGSTWGEPKFVIGLDAVSNRVILGADSDTFSDELVADKVSFISGSVPEQPVRCSAKVRYSGPDTSAVLYPLGDNAVRVKFDMPVRAVTPGQSAVFYDGDTVLGGGIIR